MLPLNTRIVNIFIDESYTSNILTNAAFTTIHAYIYLSLTLIFSYNDRMRKFSRSIGYACNGIVTTLKSERNFRIHLFLMLLTIAMGVYINLSVIEWTVITFAIGLVLSAELFNTALEKLGDEIAVGKQNLLIKNIKDMAAGAVLISAIAAFIIGILILFVPFIDKVVNLY